MTAHDHFRTTPSGDATERFTHDHEHDAWHEHDEGGDYRGPAWTDEQAAALDRDLAERTRHPLRPVRYSVGPGWAEAAFSTNAQRDRILARFPERKAEPATPGQYRVTGGTLGVVPHVDDMPGYTGYLYVVGSPELVARLHP